MAKNLISLILIGYLLLFNGFSDQSDKLDDSLANTAIPISGVMNSSSLSIDNKIKDVWIDIKEFFENLYCGIFDCKNDDKNGGNDKIDTTNIGGGNSSIVVEQRDTTVLENGQNSNLIETEEEDYEDDFVIEDDVPVKEDPYIAFRNKIQSTYISQIGVREKTGKNDGVMVEKYLNSAGLSKGNPWCAAFVYYTFKQNGANLKVSGKGWVPSYFPENKTIYVRGKYSKMNPKYGDLIGIWFENKGRLAHIGFYDSEDDTYYYTVEGNTNEAGSREGDGVYRKKRLKRQVHSISNWID